MVLVGQPHLICFLTLIYYHFCTILTRLFLTILDFEITRPDHNSYYDAVANSMLDASAMPDVIILSSDYLALYASQGLLKHCVELII